MMASLRIKPSTDSMWRAISAHLGISKVAVFEMLVHEKAFRSGLFVAPSLADLEMSSIRVIRREEVLPSEIPSYTESPETRADIAAARLLQYIASESEILSLVDGETKTDKALKVLVEALARISIAKLGSNANIRGVIDVSLPEYDSHIQLKTYPDNDSNPAGGSHDSDVDATSGDNIPRVGRRKRQPQTGG